jgi:hypothetical protein
VGSAVAALLATAVRVALGVLVGVGVFVGEASATAEADGLAVAEPPLFVAARTSPPATASNTIPPRARRIGILEPAGFTAGAAEPQAAGAYVGAAPQAGWAESKPQLPHMV